MIQLPWPCLTTVYGACAQLQLSLASKFVMVPPLVIPVPTDSALEYGRVMHPYGLSHVRATSEPTRIVDSVTGEDIIIT